MNKTAIKNFAVWARRKLISEITYKAEMIGVSANGILEPLPNSTKDLQLFDVGTKDYAEVSGEAVKQRSDLVAAIRAAEKGLKYSEAFENVIEEVAYTWFNRLIAIRFMEVNDYLPSGVRVLSSESPAKSEPDFVTTPFDTDLEFTPYEQDKVLQLKDENKLDELFRMLFIKECNKLNEILPELFEKTSDYTELLLTLSFTDKDGVVYHLIHDIAEDDFDVSKEGQVEIIGWLYQYYNTEPKDKVFANLKKNIKITKENIPAATQLFTPDWIVRYMVENSLGRLWVERNLAQDDHDIGHWEDNNLLKSNWKYYIEEADQEKSVQEQLYELRKSYKDLTPEDIKVIDPCMGSGHILVYMFDVLMQIYESMGYTQRDAAAKIVKKNLYGLDIDKRAAQLSYFAVMMKARQYDRRFLTRGICPNVYAIIDSEGIGDAYQFEMGNFLLSKEHQETLNYILDVFKDAKEYGSIIQLEGRDYVGLRNAWENTAAATTENFNLTLWYSAVEQAIPPLIEQAIILSQKYDVVCTNPPYMGASGMSGKLSDYVKKNYPDSKSDLSTCFMEKCAELTNINGYYSMINIPVWMFLSSYENLRKNIIKNNTFVNMVHPGRGIFGSDFGTTIFVVAKQKIDNYTGKYHRLFDIQGEVKSNETRENDFLSGKGCYFANQDNFSKIPGSPVAYWVSKQVVNCFSDNKSIDDLAYPRQGLATGNNERFLRLWYEVNNVDISRNSKCQEDFFDTKKKYVPYNKGGAFRKWYANIEWIIRFDKPNFDILQTVGNHLPSKEFYFRKSITWSKVTSGGLSMRYIPEGSVFDVAGCSIFADSYLPYILAFTNSNIMQYLMDVLSQTLNYEVGNVKAIPLILGEQTKEVENISNNNIILSKRDLDSFETSWDFTTHPLIGLSKDLWDCTYIEAHMKHYYGCLPEISCPLELCYMLWKGQSNKQFQELKSNEEELNRIFIDIYGLQDELTPEVEDKDITVHYIADTKEDAPESMRNSNYLLTKKDVIKSLISYAVGCMFGRYSLDTEGLVYAGGEWDGSKYKTYMPDDDNCIPITDEEYFKDDIVGRFCEFVKAVYGEETLEENLDFIASALGNKGNTSREVIRNYFLNDFIKDHIKTYQKRPIYWQFDSGKQNGFKALCYMHRYNADTIGNMRIEYLHRVQRVYEKEIERMQEIIDNSTNAREVSTAEKRKDKLTKQLKETKDYDEKVAHLALSRIDIDLDDGVKVNYEKVQTAQDGRKLEILAKI